MAAGVDNRLWEIKDIVAMIEEYLRIKQMQDLLDAQLAKAREGLVASLGKGTAKLTNQDGAPLLSYTPTASSGSFDRKSFAAAHPRIHARFWTPGVPEAGTPRLSVNR